ncbi:Nucleobase-ascorbate transporter 11 [Glycine soja]|uniref:Nucleobase-ascorbate transporter 11 n=1 Tax=Glycine soja TaxID=3848 RepID=A0A0B2RVN9_GLYSO|nr:Nucleobase-ascorbate transporter 11 [Glycine soja]
METGSSSEFLDKGKAIRGGTGKRHDVVSDTKVEPFVARSDHNPKELKSWAKRTGFVSNYSGEVGTSASENFDSVGEGRSSPKIEIDPVLGLVRPNRENEIEPIFVTKHGDMRVNGDAYGMTVSTNRNINSHGVSAVAPLPEQKKEKEGIVEDVKVNHFPEGEEPASRGWQVPLTVTLTWIYASFLTAGGGYNYKGCNPNIPSSNILIGACRKHAYTMKHCRTDISNALLTSAWLRILYPLQWGFPIFHFRTCIMMAIVSLAASVDSVGTYYSASLRVNLRPLSPGVVSRGIALEGLYSILAGLWGSGTGSTTLTENVQTIDTTKVASRRVVELGAAFMILFSFMGKVGALIASIPQALAASVLCFIWALIAALGLSNLQYGKCASFRNMKIVGVSLFLGPWSINPCLFSTIQASNQSDTTCLPVTLWGCI